MRRPVRDGCTGEASGCADRTNKTADFIFTALEDTAMRPVAQKYAALLRQAMLDADSEEELEFIKDAVLLTIEQEKAYRKLIREFSPERQ